MISEKLAKQLDDNYGTHPRLAAVIAPLVAFIEAAEANAPEKVRARLMPQLVSQLVGLMDDYAAEFRDQ